MTGNALALVALTLVAAGPPSASLRDAETAYQQGRFQEVLPLVHEALEGRLDVQETVRAHVLAAHVQVAFGRSAEAVKDFRAALAADPRYRPPDNESPKVKDLFAQALGQLLLVAPPPDPHGHSLTASPTPSATAVVPRRPPWLIIGLGVGVVVIAGVATTFGILASQPSGNLGRTTVP